MDLQHHLVGHQQQIALARGAVRRRQQLQCLVGNARAGAVETVTGQHFETALRERAVVAAQRAHLGVAIGMRGDAQLWHDEAETLIDAHAVAGDVELIGMRDLHARRALDNARIDIGGRAFACQQADRNRPRARSRG